MQFTFKDTALVEEARLHSLVSHLNPYIKHLQKVAALKNYIEAESSINLPFDEDLLKTILETKERKCSNKLKYIIDIGIGGSNLGTKAIYDALKGYADLIEPNAFPKIIFVDTNSPINIWKLQQFLEKINNPDEVLINTISKSGTTTETIANMELLAGCIKNYKDRTVITTDEDSKLWNVAEKEKITHLKIPAIVGGRYSVFSAVGLFPLACAGINIVSLLSGAMYARRESISLEEKTNFAAVSAAISYVNYKNGKFINDNFMFSPELESLGKWYRQLMAESLGKKHVGITPTVSIGSTDLHSMGQLYLGGPKDKFFTFVSATKELVNPKIPGKPPIPTNLKEIKEKSADEIMNAIYQGTTEAFAKKRIPFTEIKLDTVTEREVGAFMQFKMLEIMYLAKLLGVNAFNQPNVESYKSITKEILKEN